MNRFISLLLFAVPFLFAACGDDEHYHGGHQDGGNQNGGYDGDGKLNQYEQQLVGSYVSDDNPASVFYLILNGDRTGSYRSVSGGQTKYEEFGWCADARDLTVQYTSDGYTETMEYYYADNHLYVDGIPLVVNDGGTQEEQSPLIGQWRGVINGYYNSVWGLADGDYGTICEFTADGYGCQLDYDIYSPRLDYAYTPFTWSQVGDVITVTYDTGSNLSAARISNYALTSAKFTGQMSYGDKTFTFNFDKESGFDWTPYLDTDEPQAKGRMRMLRKSGTGLVRCGAFAASSLARQ